MKKGNIMRDVISSSQFTANVIKEYKKGLGDVVLVAITPRTTIELPAHLTQAEIDARVEIYNKGFRLSRTNAAAEAFNAKIKAFRASFRGVVDMSFFLFRLAKVYA